MWLEPPALGVSGQVREMREEYGGEIAQGCVCLRLPPGGDKMMTCQLMTPPQLVGCGAGVYFLDGWCIQGWRISLLTSESRCCCNFRSLPVGHPRALWGEGMGWHGLGTQTECLIKPGGLQTLAWASQVVELGLPATWAPAVPPPLAPHSWRAAAPDVASLVYGSLSCQGSEPAGPPDTGLGSHWRDLSSLSQPRAASAVKC